MEPSSSCTNTDNFFETTAIEILAETFKYCPERMLNVNQHLRSVAKFCFGLYNREIVGLCPSLQGVYEAKKDKTDGLKLFRLLMTALHDQAGELGCDVTAPSIDNRLEWECQNFRTLAIKVNEITDGANELIKAHDFRIFVQKVAKAMKVKVILKDIKIPDKSKGADTDSEDTVESDWKANNVENHKVWNALLEDKRIEKVKSLEFNYHPTISNEEGIHFLPPEIGKLAMLEDLRISRSKLKGLPHEISNLKNLKSLKICGTDSLKTFPPVIFKLSQLERLYIYQNENFIEIPAEIKKLRNLKVLQCCINRLKEIPSEIGQLTSLIELDLMGNHLQNFPIEIKQLSRLTKLYLAAIKLNNIPFEIGQLTNLEELDLSVNPLNKFPESLYSLSNLHTLDLSQTGLTEIPSTINKLSSLKNLRLDNNKLQKPPLEMGHLPLKDLSLQRTGLKVEDLPINLQNNYKNNKLIVYTDLTISLALNNRPAKMEKLKNNVGHVINKFTISFYSKSLRIKESLAWKTLEMPNEDQDPKNDKDSKKDKEKDPKNGKGKR